MQRFKSVFSKAMMLSIGLVTAAIGVGQGASAIAIVGAQEQEISDLDRYFSDPSIINAELSPDGEELLIVKTVAIDTRAAFIYKTNDLSIKPNVIGSDKLEFRSASFVANGKLFVSFRNLVDAGQNSRVQTQTAFVNSWGKSKFDVLATKKEIINLVRPLRDKPDEILVRIRKNKSRNGKQPRFGAADFYIYNLTNGRQRLVAKQPDSIRLGGFDEEGVPRLGTSYSASANEFTQYVRLEGSSDWTPVKVITPEDRETFEILGPVRGEKNTFWLQAHMGQNTEGVYKFNAETREVSERLFGSKKYDGARVLFSGLKGENLVPVGYSYSGGKGTVRRWTDDRFKAEYAQLEATFPGKRVSIFSRSDDNQTQVVFTSSAQDAGTYYLYKKNEGIVPIGRVKPLLDESQMADQKYVSYKARDGRKIHAYVTLPTSGEAPFPTIVHPHGGPWVRDFGGFDDWSQYMAHLGFMVIRPNYRGSTGYGMDHWKAGDAKWGKEMQDDVDDAAFWAFKKGLADPDKTLIHGYSYGGYSSLVGSFREGGPWQCAIGGGSVADMQRWANVTNGNDFGRARQKPTLAGLNPLDHARNVRMPILVLHGANDDNVVPQHSRDFVSNLRKAGKKVTYVEIEGMGHTIDRWDYDDRIQYWSAVTEFLQNDCWGNDNRLASAR